MRSPTKRIVAAGSVALVAAAGSVVAWSVGSSSPAPPTREDGSPDAATLFRTYGCAACHNGPDGTGTSGVGPDLATLAEQAAERVQGLTEEEYVEQSIRDPGAYLVPGYSDVGYSPVMPTLGLADVEVEALVDYLLGNDDGPDETGDEQTLGRPRHG